MNKHIYSNCCHAPLVFQEGNEGTNHFTCSSCGKPCDMETDVKTPADATLVEIQTPYDKFDLHGTRLLVFIEKTPHSNEYRQIYLNEEEFKKTSFSIGTVVSKEGREETVEVRFSEESYTLPDLKQIN